MYSIIKCIQILYYIPSFWNINSWYKPFHHLSCFKWHTINQYICFLFIVFYFYKLIAKSLKKGLKIIYISPLSGRQKQMILECWPVSEIEEDVASCLTASGAAQPVWADPGTGPGNGWLCPGTTTKVKFNAYQNLGCPPACARANACFLWP